MYSCPRPTCQTQVHNESIVTSHDDLGVMHQKVKRVPGFAALVQVAWNLRDNSPWVDSRQVSKIRLSGQWGATFRWTEPQSRSPHQTVFYKGNHSDRKNKPLTKSLQWTERTLYWHTAEVAVAIWHPAHCGVVSQCSGLSLFAPFTVDDLFPTENTNKQRRLG